ncbi:MAG TPA: S9 family peptidase [Longimicrobiales bacterium]|nr:S9 family peptidase [Longimicrobiales bacterium]
MITTFRATTRHLLVAVAAAHAFSAAVVSAQEQGLTPLQIAQIETVGAVAISPDGRYIAFTRAVPADPLQANATNAMHLYVHDRQSGDTRALVTGGSVAAVAFRPARGTVTFLATAEEGVPRSLYEVPVAGGTPARVWGFERPILAYAWAPDGARLAVMANEAVQQPATPLPYRPEFYEENLPQRGGYVVDVTSGEAPRPVRHTGSYHMMVWSPRGDRIAVSVAPTPMIDDFYMAQSVKVVDAATLEVVADIDNAGKVGEIEWSPDGQRLALRAGHDIHDPIDGRIMVVAATGGTPRNILPDFEGKFEDIAWTGANEIHFIASEGVRSVYGRIRPDGTRLERLVAADEMALTSFDRASGGRAAFVASTPRHPPELYVLESGQRSPVRVTESNAWLANIAMGEQRVVRYQPRDGRYELEGMLILPVGHTEGARVPLITVVHGGPEAHYLNGWLTNYSMPGQLAAGRGYAVFYPNYRGSTGRGIEFAMSSQGDAAGAEFDDIVDGVDHLIRTGVADSARVGVTGGSYGGFATAWMSTYYSERFAAGVMFVGISNNLSKWGTSDIPNELYLVHSRQWYHDNWQKYLERSPIYHVDRARTPLLIMHGANDTRVHPAQSLELYRHLVVRRPDVPVRLILYPGEGHGNTRSASRFDYTLRMIGWFDAYLQGDGQKPELDLRLPAMPVSEELDTGP